MKILNKVITVCASLTLFGASTTSVSAASYNQKAMRSYVRNTLANNRVRGSVVVVKNGHAQEISYGYGFYGKRWGNGASNVVYPICSLEKVITAAIIEQLISVKKFSENTAISRWYPHIKNARHIKVANLLTHTSGILVTGTETDRGIRYSEAGAINYVANLARYQKAGKVGKFHYNNTNYILLAGIISKETGISFAQNVINRVIEPLGLQHTYLNNRIARGKHRAKSYIWNYHNYQDPEYSTFNQIAQLPGAANIFSTPMDYYKIQVGLTNGKILTQKQFDHLTHLSQRATSYSGGVYIKNRGKVKMAYGNLYHTHFGNWFQLTRDNKNGLIMFLNQTYGNENNNKDVGYQILNHIKANTFVNR